MLNLESLSKNKWLIANRKCLHAVIAVDVWETWHPVFLNANNYVTLKLPRNACAVSFMFKGTFCWHKTVLGAHKSYIPSKKREGGAEGKQVYYRLYNLTQTVCKYNPTNLLQENLDYLCLVWTQVNQSVEVFESLFSIWVTHLIGWRVRHHVYCGLT